MYNVHTHKQFPDDKAAADFDFKLRTSFGNASEKGELRLDWNTAQTSVNIDFTIHQVRDALELAKLFELIGGGAEIRKAA